MSDVTNLLNDLKKYREDMVARNYPFQRISDIIVNWEHYLADKESQRADTPQDEWLEGYNKWKETQDPDASEN